MVAKILLTARHQHEDTAAHPETAAHPDTVARQDSVARAGSVAGRTFPWRGGKNTGVHFEPSKSIKQSVFQSINQSINQSTLTSDPNTPRKL